MKSHLIKIYPENILRNLETLCFSGTLPLSLSNYANQEEEEQRTFESFAINLETLDAYFKQYEELINITDNFYKNINLNTDLRLSKILFYPSGYDGKIHFDCDPHEKELVTSITFLNSDWQPSWGGEILVYDDDHRILDGTVPVFGKSFIFRSYLKHRAVAPIRLSSLIICVLVTKSTLFKEIQ